MIHVVFNEPDLEVISKAIEMDDLLNGQILIVRDDYAVGPLENIYTPHGIENRKEWWRMVLEGGDYQHLLEEGVVNDELVLEKIKESLENDPNEEIWIWAAQKWKLSQSSNHAKCLCYFRVTNHVFPCNQRKSHYTYGRR